MLLPPATKLGQGNIFRSVCQEFCPWGDLPHCMLWYTIHLDQRQALPWDKTIPGTRTPRTRHTCGTRPPRTRHPPGPDTPRPNSLAPGTPSGTRHSPWPGTPLGPGTPQLSVCWEIRATSRRYAPYWNAILLWKSLMPALLIGNFVLIATNST